MSTNIYITNGWLFISRERILNTEYAREKELIFSLGYFWVFDWGEVCEKKK